jgi:hypothetical protein
MFCLPDIFWINFADIEMKLGVIVYNNELQIKLSFVVIDQYLTELWPLDLVISRGPVCCGGHFSPIYFRGMQTSSFS